MAVRIMIYAGQLHQDLIQSQNLRYENKLPPVLPIVLYNGDPEWTAATNIKQLIQEIPGGLARYRPSLQYLLLAEQAFGDEDLARTANQNHRLESTHEHCLTLSKKQRRSLDPHLRGDDG